MRDDIKDILISEAELQKKVEEIGAQITEDFKGKTPIIVSVLKGSFVFMADLVRQISLPCQIEFMSVSSYGASSNSSGEVKIVKDLDVKIEGRDIIIVEDILDSGLTLSYILDIFSARGAKSISICTLFNKPARRKKQVTVNYSGFEIPDEFIVGYGLDYAEQYRNLPYVGILKPEVYGA